MGHSMISKETLPECSDCGGLGWDCQMGVGFENDVIEGYCLCPAGQDLKVGDHAKGHCAQCSPFWNGGECDCGKSKA